ncbi:OmpA family protein [Afifella pfennigii]|uniref:OmpA family protein n=1 Tax=Afifella pfennigii TaxID=209897 RepID=UPI000555C4B3|nr:OmpA family protein [Afifella pfennigii]
MKFSTLMIGAALALPLPAIASADTGRIVLAQANLSAELQAETARQNLAAAEAALAEAEASGQGVEEARAAVEAARQTLAEAEAAEAAAQQPQEPPAANAAEAPPQPAEQTLEQPAPEAAEEPAAQEQAAPQGEPAPAAEAEAPVNEQAPEKQAAEEPAQQASPAAEPPAAEAEAPVNEQPPLTEQSEEQAAEEPSQEAPAAAQESEAAEQPQETSPNLVTPEAQQQAEEPAGERAPAANAPAAPATTQQGTAPEQVPVNQRRRDAEAPAPAQSPAETAQPDAAAAPENLGIAGEEPDPQMRELRQKLRAERRQAEGRRDDDNDALRTGAAAALGAAAGALAGRVIESYGDRVVIERDGQRYIRSDSETDRLLRRARDVEVEDLGEGRTRTVVTRPNGAEIITIRDYDGSIIRRTRRTPDGREIVLIDDRWAGPRERRRAERFEQSLPPLRYDLPRERYIVDLGRASQDDLRQTLAAPPVEPVERAYTLEEVRDSARLRDKLRRVDLDAITFATDSAAIARSEVPELARIGRAMEDLLAQNPNELFLIEGHTDAVGSDLYNLALSDRRAESVAIVLSENFDIPPENLVTQGYGEQYLKVPTEAPERQNRRVTMRRITPLVQGQVR